MSLILHWTIDFPNTVYVIIYFCVPTKFYVYFVIKKKKIQI